MWNWFHDTIKENLTKDSIIMVSDTELEPVVPQIETLYEQDFYSLRDECLHNNFLFEDPEFLPREEFLRERSKQHEDIVWLRPHDISRPDEPILVSNKNEGFDIKQVCIKPD